MKEQFLESRKIYFRTNEIGKERKTLVFVHGLSGSSSAWFAYEDFFQNEYNVVTFDLRGHGKSFKYKETGEYRMEDLEGDLLALVDYLELKNFVLIGHSFGSLIALGFALNHQERVSSLILLSPNHSVGHVWLGRLLTTLIPVARFLDKTFASVKKPGHVDYAKYKNTGDWNIPRMIADVGNTSIAVYFQGTIQSCGFQKTNLLKELKMPVLLVHGKKDTIFSVKNSIFMKGEIKNSSLVILDDSDHIVVLNNFPEISKLLLAFIRSNA